MKIRIDTPLAKLTADLTEEQVAEILGIALDYAVGFERPIQPESIDPTPVEVSAPVPVEPVIMRNPTSPNPTEIVEYKGFMYIECEKCHKFKAFMPKTPISKYRCDCGYTTHLTSMRTMRVDCKCGSKFKYLTNALEGLLSIDCYNCGSPVDLEYHERKKEYTTI